MDHRGIGHIRNAFIIAIIYLFYYLLKADNHISFLRLSKVYICIIWLFGAVTITALS